MMKEWICPTCGHEVLADERPSPIKWTDGHRCVFMEVLMMTWDQWTMIATQILAGIV